MENKVADLIRQATEDKTGSRIFYMSLWPRERKFEISCSGFNQFIINYCEMIFSTIQHKNDAHEQKLINPNYQYDTNAFGCPFAEVADNNRVPLMVTMLVEVQDNEHIKFYGQKFIYTCTSIIQQSIINLFEVNNDMHELKCFVLESDIWSDNGKQYIQIRFHFPFTLVDIEYINNTFYPHIIKEFNSENILHLMMVTPIVSIDKIVQKQTEVVISPGCKSNQRHAPMTLKYLLNYIDGEQIPRDNCDVPDFSFSLIDSSISPYLNTFFSKRLIEGGVIESVDDPIFWLPLILSVHFTGAITRILQNNNPQRIPTPPQIQLDDFDANRYTPKMKLNDLLAMISPYRLNQKNFWYDIGRCIHNIYHGDRIGISVWQDASYDIILKDECADEYFKFKDEFLDIRTIAWYAKEDSPEQYVAWHTEWISKDMESSLGCDHVPTAQVIYKTLWLEYIYDANSTSWYHYVENRMKKDLGGLELANDLTEVIIPLYQRYRDFYIQKSNAEKGGGPAGKVYEQSVKQITMMIKKLNTSGFRDSVMKIAREKFKDDYFTLYADENLDTIGWRNGVSECYDDTITFRGGKPQDYITLSTRNRFPSHFDDTNPQLRFMKEYYSMLHTDPEMRHYFLKDQGSFLQGGNPEKFFRNWIGKSDASKSQYVKFLQEAFGDYCADLPNSAITLSAKGGSGNGPDSAMEFCKGARLAIVAETSISEPLDAAKIKKFTGNDRYFNRTLNEKGGKRVLSFKLIHMSNVIANTPNADEAFQGREIIITFSSRWVVDPPATLEEQYKQRLFKRDETFTKKIRSHTQAQIYLMFKYFPIYKREGLRNNIPECILKVTLLHQHNNDPFYNFIQEKVEIKYLNEDEKIRDNSISMSATDLYPFYKRWFMQCYPNTPIIDQIRFKTEMIGESHLGRQIYNGRWAGVAIKDNSSGAGLV